VTGWVLIAIISFNLAMGAIYVKLETMRLCAPKIRRPGEKPDVVRNVGRNCRWLLRRFSSTFYCFGGSARRISSLDVPNPVKQWRPRGMLMQAKGTTVTETDMAAILKQLKHAEAAATSAHASRDANNACRESLRTPPASLSSVSYEQQVLRDAIRLGASPPRGNPQWDALSRRAAAFIPAVEAAPPHLTPLSRPRLQSKKSATSKKHARGASSSGISVIEDSSTLQPTAHSRCAVKDSSTLQPQSSQSLLKKEKLASLSKLTKPAVLPAPVDSVRRRYSITQDGLQDASSEQDDPPVKLERQKSALPSEQTIDKPPSLRYRRSSDDGSVPHLSQMVAALPSARRQLGVSEDDAVPKSARTADAPPSARRRLGGSNSASTPRSARTIQPLPAVSNWRSARRQLDGSDDDAAPKSARTVEAPPSARRQTHASGPATGERADEPEGAWSA